MLRYTSLNNAVTVQNIFGTLLLECFSVYWSCAFKNQKQENHGPFIKLFIFEKVLKVTRSKIWSQRCAETLPIIRPKFVNTFKLLLTRVDKATLLCLVAGCVQFKVINAFVDKKQISMVLICLFLAWLVFCFLLHVLMLCFSYVLKALSFISRNHSVKNTQKRSDEMSNCWCFCSSIKILETILAKFFIISKSSYRFLVKIQFFYPCN